MILCMVTSFQIQHQRHDPMEEIIDKLNLVKIKNFCSVKEYQKWKTSHSRKKTFAKDTSDKGPLSKIYKELLKLSNKKTNGPIKKWAKHLNRHFTEEDIQITNKHMKRYSTYIIRKMQIKTRYHHTPTRMAEIQNTDNSRCCQRGEAKGTLIHCWWYSHFGRLFGGFLQN